MSEVIKKMLSRRSVREYKSEMVPKDIIERILEAGTFAATGMGKQSPIMLAITKKEVRDKLSEMVRKAKGKEEGVDPFYGAPVAIVVLAYKNISTHVYDGSLVMGNLMLAAHELGLGSCWIHQAKEVFQTEEGKKFLEKFGIKGDYEGIGTCVLGYATDDISQAKPRKESYIYYAE